MWTIANCFGVLQKVEQVAKQHGYHVALGGSVMYRGESSKDLDIIVYPHNSNRVTELNLRGFQLSIISIGFSNIYKMDKYDDNGDTKLVWIADYKPLGPTGITKRVDFLFPYNSALIDYEKPIIINNPPCRNIEI